MNSLTEKKSIEELKALHSRYLAEANEGERFFSVSEKNWSAVLNLLSEMCSQQLVILAALGQLLTKPDVQEMLDQISRNTQTQLQLLRDRTDQFSQQAGSMNAKFSSAADGLVSDTEKALRLIENSTERSMRDMCSRTDSELKNLIRTARRWLVALGLACIAAVLSVAALYFVVILRRLA